MNHPPFPNDKLSLRYHRISRAWGDARYDPKVCLLTVPFVREVPSNGRHITRDSLYYARILLDTGEEEAAIARACSILDAVIATQVTRDGSPVRGNFPWFAEEGEQGT